MKDYYKVLGLTRDASQDQVKQKFRELAFENHPDVSENSNAADIFVEIYEAYQVLSHPDKKAGYDLLYDFYIASAGIKIPNEDAVKTEVRNLSASARENARKKAGIKYRDFIKELDCWFIEGQKADGIPYPYRMHKNIGISGGTGPMGSIKSRTINIPVPRSKRAHLFHRMGFTIKLLFLVIAVASMRIEFVAMHSFMTRALIFVSILLSGGAVTMFLYLVKKVKSKFFSAGNYFLVKKYRSKGFRRGFHPMISTTPAGPIAYLLRIIF